MAELSLISIPVQVELRLVPATVAGTGEPCPGASLHASGPGWQAGDEVVVAGIHGRLIDCWRPLCDELVFDPDEEQPGDEQPGDEHETAAMAAARDVLGARVDELTAERNQLVNDVRKARRDMAALVGHLQQARADRDQLADQVRDATVRANRHLAETIRVRGELNSALRRASKAESAEDAAITERDAALRQVAELEAGEDARSGEVERLQRELAAVTADRESQSWQRQAAQINVRKLVEQHQARIAERDKALKDLGEANLRADLLRRQVEDLTAERDGVVVDCQSYGRRNTELSCELDAVRAVLADASSLLDVVLADGHAGGLVTPVHDAAEVHAWRQRAAAVRALVAVPVGEIQPGRGVLAVVAGTASETGDVWVKPWDGFAEGGASVVVKPLLVALEPPPF